MGGDKNCLFSAWLHRTSQRQRQTFQRSETDISAVKEWYRTLRKRLVESCWSNQNWEMEIESLRIQIILSTKPRKQTAKQVNVPVTKTRSCLPHIVRIYQTGVVFLSLWHPDRTNESRCDFFVLYAFVQFFCGVIKRSYYTGIESVACFFLCPCGCDKNSFFSPNSDSFRRGAQPDQLSQSDRSEGPSDHCSDQNFTTWIIVVVPSTQRRGPEWFYFGQNSQSDEIQWPAVEFYVRNIP